MVRINDEHCHIGTFIPLYIWVILFNPYVHFYLIDQLSLLNEKGNNDLFSLFVGEKTLEIPSIVYIIDPITKTAGVLS